jgi:hypothetical protein
MVTVFAEDPEAADMAGREAKVVGTWSSQISVEGKEPLSFDIPAEELSKGQ